MQIINIQEAVLGISLEQESKLLTWLMQRHCHRVGAPMYIPSPPSDYPTMGAVEEWWRGKLATGDLLPGRGWITPVVTHDMAVDYTKALGLDSLNFRGNAISLGYCLAQLVPGLAVITATAGRAVGGRARFYRFPALATCRANFEAVYGPQLWREE